MDYKRLLSISSQVFLHILFWFIVSLFFLYFSILRPRCTSKVEMEFVCILVIAITCYFNYFVLYPRYFKKKQVKYWSALLLSVIAVSIIEILFFWSDFADFLFSTAENRIIFIFFFIAISLRNVSFLLFSLFLRHYQEVKNGLQREIQILEKEIAWYAEKRDVERNFTRSKIAAHFLFNIINHIIVCSTEKKDNLPHLLRQLSTILEYYMISSSREFVDINDELIFYQNFIELEKYRYDYQIGADFQIIGEPKMLKVAPLLFETFIANAFKYVPRDGSESISIKFDFSEANCILFTCINSKRKKINPEIVSSKSGIKTVLRRLDLLYEKTYSFHIQENEDTFMVTLRLDLTSMNRLTRK